MGLRMTKFQNRWGFSDILSKTGRFLKEFSL